ncbi:hypothetical protein E8E13_007243 [Curvularia kusanoi]|uniref:Heterokaryon incompatibility domain-containing protein n=1 Tax=Curvularia kusanoi TaxID=90978 RepID=A0A9P4TMS7_CURKU|nr:hypothetical protein E8E13_007243 [Curvularia kusanoi]
MPLPANEQPESPYYGQALEIGEIRLLTIHWTTLDQFELRTERHSLNADLKFDAISYVWGTTPASVRVKCNNGTILITPSAFEMLGYLYLYKPEPERPIWIDAICINQNDAEEKAVQVPLMHHIYSGAETVFIWPGRLEQTALDCARDLQDILLPWDSYAAQQAVLQRWPLEWYSEWTPFWCGLVQLVSIEWFERLWTLQEAVLAKQAILFCSRSWVVLDQLLYLVLTFFVDQDHPFGYNGSIEYRFFQEWRNIEWLRGPGRVGAEWLPYLLDKLRLRCSVEEVDRIWAIFGILGEELQSLLSPLIDYTEIARREYWHTLTNCMKKVVTASQNLEVLHVVRAHSVKHPYLPSWCPDLRGRGEVPKYLTQFWIHEVDRIRQQRFRGTEDVEMIQEESRRIGSHGRKLIIVSENNNYMSVHGFEVDTIVEIVEDTCLVGAWHYTLDFTSFEDNYKEENPTHVAAMRWLKSGIELASRAFQQHVNDEDESGVAEEVFMSFWLSESVSDAGKSALTDAISSLTTFHYHRYAEDEERWNQAIAAMDQYRSLVGHTWVRTEGGRFGIATPRCRPGDKVCVFYGGQPLYVIRPHELEANCVPGDETELWDFVGLAYVPHLMNQHTTYDARKCPDRMYVLA